MSCCTFWRKNEENLYDGIFCLSYREKYHYILRDYYRDDNKVKSLISRGSIIFLDKYVSTNLPHSFVNPIPGVTIAVSDCNERDLCDLKEFLNSFGFKNEEINRIMIKLNQGNYYPPVSLTTDAYKCFAEYYNFFFENGTWKYCRPPFYEFKKVQ